MDEVLALVRQGVREFDEFQDHFDHPIDPVRIGKEIVAFNLLPGYTVNIKERRLMPVNEFENMNQMVTVTWVCSSCHAKNSVRIKKSENAACEFCGQPKVSGPPPRPA